MSVAIAAEMQVAKRTPSTGMPASERMRGIDDDDVSHGHERGHAGQKLAANGGLVFLEVKDAFQQVAQSPELKVSHYRSLKEAASTAENE